MSGEDVVLDREIFLFDVRATAAHACGLAQIGVLSERELSQIEESLADLARQFSGGQFVLEPPMEDSHSAIEFWLSEKLPGIGPKVHTGRSRNDQVQVALRMYLRDRLDRLSAASHELAAEFLKRAAEDEMTPMPGYTHLQRAVPASVGLWMASLAEAFLDIRALASMTREWINVCPLGTAAGFGVNLPLSRQTVSDRLEFSRLQLNPAYVQNSRGRFELQALSVLGQATLELRRFAWDVSLFATSEFDFVRLPISFRTGSSIMPNKSNPDFVELLRGQHAIVQGAMSELQSLLSLPSGYHRDLQLTKPPLFRAFGSSLESMALAAMLVKGLELNRETMAAAIDAPMYSTDVAIERVVNSGQSFRDAYRQPVTPGELAGRTPEDSLAARVSPGGCGNAGLDALRKRLEDV